MSVRGKDDDKPFKRAGVLEGGKRHRFESTEGNKDIYSISSP